MKIKEVKTEQFAGVHDLDVKLEDGLNVICGPNESGKSTFVKLIDQTFFRPARVSKKQDKDFYNLYFPSDVKNGSAGDFSNGEIQFEDDENSSYRLKKEWSKSKSVTPSARLKSQNGIVSDQETIDSEIEKVLKYGKGVYGHLLLSSQGSTADVLKSLIDNHTTGEGDSEVINGASKAFAESDGVSIDELQSSIEEQIEAIEGKHWDYEQEKPVQKYGRWGTGLGQILQAYYSMEDRKEALELLKQKQDVVDAADEDYTQAEKNAENAQNECDKYAELSPVISCIHERKTNREHLSNDLSHMKDALREWPELKRESNDAIRLSNEKKNRETLDKYTKAQTLQKEINDLKESLQKNGNPDPADVTNLGKLERDLSTDYAKLEGLKILASIRMSGNHEIHVTSLSTGKPVELENGKLHITEAVRIEIPDVMEMELAPENVNVEELQNKIVKTEASVNQILQKYNVHSFEELTSRQSKAAEFEHQISESSDKLSYILNGSSMEELKAAYEKIGKMPRENAEINAELEQLGIENPDETAAVDQRMIHNYEQEYKTFENLEKSASEIQSKLNTVPDDEEQIPEECRNISDLSGFQDDLKEKSRNADAIKEDALQNKTRAESELENFLGDKTASDLLDEYDASKQKFDQLKEDLAQWKHIQQVFMDEKEKIASHPMEDLTAHFNEYLNLLTDGSVETEANDPDKLNLKVYSGNNLVDYDKLSEGTKDTVSLAFRLAVLDHLFPDGGGVIALDDPFTDMDEKRLQAACHLVQKAAERHQVIFLTCREDVAEKLGGNQILWKL